MTGVVPATDTIVMLDDTRVTLPWMFQTIVLLSLALLLIPGGPALQPGCAAALILGSVTSTQGTCGSTQATAPAGSTSAGPAVWWRDVLPAGWRPELRIGPHIAGPSRSSVDDATPGDNRDS